MNRFVLVVSVLLWGSSTARLSTRKLEDDPLFEVVNSDFPSLAPSTIPVSLSTIAPVLVLPAPVTSSPVIPASESPSSDPIGAPSTTPSVAPFESPSASPSAAPFESPSTLPTSGPSFDPSTTPTFAPSTQPSSEPSFDPTSSPSSEPTSAPSTAPSTEPSSSPSTSPSTEPSSIPTTTPSTIPTTMPSLSPSVFPTTSPSTVPTTAPSNEPSAFPSKAPVVTVPVITDNLPVPVPVPVPIPVPVPVPVLMAVPIPVKPINFTLPEIFIDCGIDSEDAPYISGRYWGSSFENEISGIPPEYRNVSEVFHTHRSGSNFAYTISRLLPYAAYAVTLGFAENYEEYCASGMRRFNVTVNSKPFETDLDVFDTVGCYRALVLKKSYKATGDGTLLIQFKAIKRHPMIAMIGIDPIGPITKVNLCKSANGTKIMSLGNLDVIDLEAIGTNEVSIVVEADPNVSRIRFRYNGEVHTEHSVPYAINGNEGLLYHAEPYLAKDGNKTIWMDAFDDDKLTVASIRLDLSVIGADSFIIEEEGDKEIDVDSPTTSSPSASPSDRPSSIPSDVPSAMPSDVPSDAPSSMPSDAPSAIPSDTPSAIPSDGPSASPSDSPSDAPSDTPSNAPFTSGQPVVA